MGLQFYFGGSGAGKSRQLHQDILAWAEKEPDCNFLFLVPDQFTMQTQVDLTTASSSGGIMNIDVLSFGRLSHRIFEETGYSSKPVLDDTGKSLVLRKVAADLADEMPVIGKNLNKLGYIHEVKSAISEFKQYGISAGQVGELAEFAKGRGALYHKLKDLEVVYKGFTDYIQDKYITTEETLELLTGAVSKSKIIQNSVIVFDGFTGFTPIQYGLIRELLTLTKRVIVSITLDILEDPYATCGEQELFYLSKKTVSDLQRLAKEAKVERVEDVFLKAMPLPRFRDNEELAHLERNLFRYPVRAFGEKVPEHIHMWEALNPAEEVKQVCIRIKEMVLEEGYRYRDIAVVCGDLEAYVDYFEREGDIYEIPFFLDKTRGLRLNPFIEYIRSALKTVLQNFSYEAVFHYLRSGLTGFAPDKIDRLENYVLALGIKGKKKWSQAFTRKIGDVQLSGISEEEEDLPTEIKEQLLLLQEMNEIREQLMEQLSPLFEKKETAGELVESLYTFIVNGRIQEKLAGYEAYFKENQEPERAKEYAQIYRLVMELLEQIYSLLKQETMTLQEFADILDAGFGEMEVGLIPGSVDRIVVGDMERSRLKQVKALFFLGVNDGNIPRGTFKGGIISDIDREFLKDSEFELAPSPRQQMYIQRLYLYMNLTKPSSELYLSYARVSSQGKSIRPSYLIDMLKKLYPGIPVKKSGVIDKPFEQIVGKRDGLTLLARQLRDYVARRQGGLSDEEFEALYRIYAEDETYGRYTEELTEGAFANYEHKPLAKAVAKTLYGSLLENSVSRLEKYAACAYSHFLQYGLMLKEREEFSFEQVDLGNVFHEVLESFAGKLAKNDLTWFDFSEEEGERLLKEALDECTMKYGETILYSSARYAYMTERMYRILKRTVMTLKHQLKEGSFVPASFEMSFSKADKLESVNIALSDREKMKLRGRIDRIDLYEDEEHVYVKVIDYKSGNKKFDLAALYYGLQLQLVVYMNVAEEMTAKAHPDKEIVPAALLYYHVSDPMVKEEKELTPEEINERLIKELRMNGIVNSGEGIVDLLDKNFSDKSSVIPVEKKKDGSYSTRSALIAQEDYKVVSGFVSRKIQQFGREILDGKIEINPCEQSGKNSCTYCAYKGVCEFESKVPGYDMRVLESPEDDQVILMMREENEKHGGFLYTGTEKSN